MKNNKTIWQCFPTGLASFIALVILIMDNTQPYIAVAFMFVVCEFALGYLKTKVNKKFEAMLREKNY